MKLKAVFCCTVCFAALTSFAMDEGNEFLSEKMFASPSAEYGPMTWWHWINGHVTKDGIKKDLEAMHAAGIRGVQTFNTHMYLARGPVEFASEEWYDLTDYAIRICDSLDMKFCITSGAGWSGSGGPWISKEQSMKKLTISETSVAGGDVAVQLIQPVIKDGYYKEIAVQAVPAKYKGGLIDDLPVKMFEKSKTSFACNYSETSASEVLDISDIIDLTSVTDSTGMLKCRLPEGEWTILRYGYTLTGKKSHPAAWGGEGYEVNKLDSADVTVQYDNFLKVLFDRNSRYLGTTIEGVLFDSYEAGFQNWTKHLPEEFMKMHGYDLLDYMPVFTGRIVVSPKVTEQVLYDFRALLDYMISEYYYGTMQRKINAIGVKVYAEAQGGPVPSMALNFVDIPMNEFWNPDTSPRMRNIRLTSSQADLRGKSVVAAEAFTSKPEDGRWQNYPGKMKKPGDLAYIGGINRFCFHTYAHQPVDYPPGFALGRYGTMFSRLSTWWDYSGEWIRYLSRCQYMLQHGIKVADITFLFDYDIRYAYNSKYTALPSGYDYRIAYPEDLSGALVRDGKIVFRNGAESSVLIIVPGHGIDIATLGKIRDLVVQGATVCGGLPVAVNSLSETRKYPADEFVRFVKQLWPSGNRKGISQVGQGRVMCGYGNREVISMLGLKKDVDFGQYAEDLHYLHKKIGDDDLYFISNQDSTEMDIEMRIRTQKKYCSLWNPVTGEVYAKAHENDGEFSTLGLQLTEFGSCFLLFTDKPVTDRCLEIKHPVQEIALDRYWTMSFEDRRQCDTVVQVKTFLPLNKWKLPDVKYYSGTVRYENSFDINARRLEKRKASVTVSFDDIHDICEVMVNGKSAGILWTRPYVLDITDFVKDGSNEITVRVAGSWINRIIGDEQLEPDMRYEMNGTKFTSGRLAAFPEWLYSGMPEDRKRVTFYTWKHYNRDSALVPSGLSGRVRIEIRE